MDDTGDQRLPAKDTGDPEAMFTAMYGVSPANMKPDQLMRMIREYFDEVKRLDGIGMMETSGSRPRGSALAGTGIRDMSEWHKKRAAIASGFAEAVDTAQPFVAQDLGWLRRFTDGAPGTGDSTADSKTMLEVWKPVETINPSFSDSITPAQQDILRGKITIQKTPIPRSKPASR